MRVVSMGAVLWDIIDNREYIGGAPFNFAANMHRLGAEIAMLTGIGRDERGERTLACMQTEGIDTQFVQLKSDAMTGIARVQLDENNNATYDIPHAAYDEIDADDACLQALRMYAPDVLCFGTLEQRSEKTRNAMRRVLDAGIARHVFYDVNIRMDFCEKAVIEYGLHRATILKLNDDECTLLARLLFGQVMPMAQFAAAVCARYALEIVIVTLGSRGCYVRSQAGDCTVSAVAAGGGDTVGAGDAFSAAFVYALLSGADAFTAATCGNTLGGYVAGRKGALPPWDDTLVAKLNEFIADRND